MNFSKRIRDTRKDRGLTQQKFAEKAGLALSQVGKLEQGAITDPHYSTLLVIADALDMSVSELLREDPANDRRIHGTPGVGDPI